MARNAPPVITSLCQHIPTQRHSILSITASSAEFKTKETGLAVIQRQIFFGVAVPNVTPIGPDPVQREVTPVAQTTIEHGGFLQITHGTSRTAGALLVITGQHQAR